MRRRSVSVRYLGLLAVAMLALAWPAPARAQAVYGSIAGSVTDSTGAAIPGATVTITSVERKTEDTVVTNASGFYEKARLLPGRYEVKAELTGFKSTRIQSVNVSVDTQTKVDVRLDLGAITETVEVTASEGQLLKTDRADVATIFETKQITELPIAERNFTRFILLTPGTQRLGWNHAASENPQGSTQTMVNGQHFSGTGYQLDGTENRDPILGIIVINPNLEAIGETKITSQNYDAEFGQATAGVVSVQTKSGTNDIHGSLFEFRRTDKWQARNPFTQPDRLDPITGRVLPETERDQFGGAIGGPIQKNKWFFFGDYQGLRSSEGGSKLLTVPTARARAGDFSEYGVNIFDPASGATPGTRTQFPGNVIPSNRISPQAQRVLALIPLPNTTGNVNGTRENYVAQGSEKFDSNGFDVRIDGRLSDRLNVFTRYSYADFLLDGPTAFGAGGGSELVSLGGQSKVKNHSVAAGFDTTLNSTTILDVRLGFFQYKVDVFPFDFGTTPASDAGIRGLNVAGDDFTSGLPAIFLRGGTADMNFGSGLGVNRCNCPLAQNEKQAQLVANLTKVLGNHSAKFGFDIRRAYNLRVPSDRHRSGELTFNAERTIGPTGGGLGLASFLLGDVSRLTRFVSSSTDARERQWRWFVYAQDTWRATPKLTINYGLRLEDIMPQSINEAGNAGFLDINTGEIKVVGVGGIGLDGDVENTINFAPRLGITYQLNPKTVIRAGYGRSYDIGVFGSTFGHSVTQNLPVLSAQELNPPNNFDAVFNLRDGAPAPTFAEPGSNGRFPLPNGVFTRLLPEKQRLPFVDAYNLTIQRQLSDTVSVEAGYVGNKGTHVFFGDGPAVNFNQPTIVGFPNLSTDQRRPFFNGPVGGFGGRFGWTQGIDYFCNCGDNNYHSLQAKLTRRFANGYSFLVTYTLQRIRNHDGGVVFFNRDVEYGAPDWARTHLFTLVANVELPFGKGKKFAGDASNGLDAIIGGWQFNTNVAIASGSRFNVGYRDSGADRDTGPGRPNLIGDPQVGSGDGRTSPYFNVTPIGSPGSPWGRPAVGTFGDLERGSLAGPGAWNVDASLFKRFRLGDPRSLELRFEVENVFNHVNLGTPDATIGVPGNLNPNAGFITSTAANWVPRRVQLAARFLF